MANISIKNTFLDVVEPTAVAGDHGRRTRSTPPTCSARAVPTVQDPNALLGALQVLRINDMMVGRLLSPGGPRSSACHSPQPVVEKDECGTTASPSSSEAHSGGSVGDEACALGPASSPPPTAARPWASPGLGAATAGLSRSAGAWTPWTSTPGGATQSKPRGFLARRGFVALCEQSSGHALHCHGGMVMRLGAFSCERLQGRPGTSSKALPFKLFRPSMFWCACDACPVSSGGADPGGARGSACRQSEPPWLSHPPVEACVVPAVVHAGGPGGASAPSALARRSSRGGDVLNGSSRGAEGAGSFRVRRHKPATPV
eukprot:CAMPEP_0170265434 /NCGR_PEP_ID=MMETSP0116_2-20130129/32622_1 /TAXON_ID=400756 /ORGANISM="Durinskia baltica, Strain CSIRO CS-38" /LENGTH=315 /DNA_ID=CAMNT_0010516547 /DNA_START=45 /DNA_END=993 /DNA_ORIENTATION=-